jgi:hypothetical protein
MAERLRLISTPNLGYPYQVVRADGLPEVRLTLFADHLQKSMSALGKEQILFSTVIYGNNSTLSLSRMK